MTDRWISQHSVSANLHVSQCILVYKIQIKLVTKLIDSAVLNKWVLSLCLKDPSDCRFLMSDGNWFHAAGADTAKDRCPKFVDGKTTMRYCSKVYHSSCSLYFSRARAWRVWSWPRSRTRLDLSYSRADSVVGQRFERGQFGGTSGSRPYWRHTGLRHKEAGRISERAVVWRGSAVLGWQGSSLTAYVLSAAVFLNWCNKLGTESLLVVEERMRSSGCL